MAKFDDDPVMDVGMKKGKRISQINSGYLKWMAETWREKTQWDRHLVGCADAEWQHREHSGTHFYEDLE